MIAVGNCCLNVGISRFLVEMQASYMSFTSNYAKSYLMKITFKETDILKFIIDLYFLLCFL